MPEYAAGAAAGTVDPAAAPSVTHAGDGLVVHGNRAPAVVLRRVIARALVDEATRRGFAIVSLRDGAHLDRLTPLAEMVTAAGFVVLGWVNAGGAAQRVPPPGAATARIAANPMMFGCPAPPGPPVVLDLSTSTAADGAVRAAWHAGRLVAGDHLRDRRGRPVRDPAAFCDDPPEAYLTSLGGSAADKGAALAAMVEILAGIIGGGGFVAQPGPTPGGAGLFVAFSATALGRDLGGVGAEIGALQARLTAPPHTAESRGRPPRARAAGSIQALGEMSIVDESRTVLSRFPPAGACSLTGCCSVYRIRLATNLLQEASIRPSNPDRGPEVPVVHVGLIAVAVTMVAAIVAMVVLRRRVR